MALETRELRRKDGGGTILVVVDPDDPDNHDLILNLTTPGPLSLVRPVGEAGGGATVYDQLELLRRKVDGIGDIVDAAFIGGRRPNYAGNINVTSLNGLDAFGFPFVAAANTIAQHQVDPDVQDDTPIAPALHVFRSIRAESRSVTVNRPGLLLEAIYQGTVTDSRPMFELVERLADGATRTGPWIADRLRTFSIERSGTFYSRGGLLLFGESTHAVLRGGNLFVEDGGVAAVLGPSVISDTNPSTVTECSLAMARTSDTTAQIGDLYGLDLGVLTLQGNVRALNPSGDDTYFRSKGLILDTDPLPSFFTAGNRGIFWDSADDVPKKWDGSTETELGGSGSGSLAEYSGYPSWSQDLGTMFPDRVYNWGPFGNADWPSYAGTQPTQGHESDGSRQTSYVATSIADDPTAATLAWSCGVPEGFSSWGANGLGIKTKVTATIWGGATIVVTLTAYNPATGATSAATRSVTADDAGYVETTITPPGTWQGGDLLRFTLNFTTTVVAGIGVASCKIGRIRTDWT
jgi:hypothetical protein